MAKIKFKPNAALLFKARITPTGPGSERWSPSHEQWRFFYAMQALNGREVPLVGLIVGGLDHHIYVLLPDEDAFKTYESRVIAVSREWADEIDETNLQTPPTETSPYAAIWEASGLKVVRLLTPYVDGFSAFTPILPGENEHH